MDRTMDMDCVCEHCKGHVCDLILSSNGLRCRDPNCERNISSLETHAVEPRDYRGGRIEVFSTSLDRYSSWVLQSLSFLGYTEEFVDRKIDNWKEEFG